MVRADWAEASFGSAKNVKNTYYSSPGVRPNLASGFDRREIAVEHLLSSPCSAESGYRASRNRSCCWSAAGIFTVPFAPQNRHDLSLDITGLNSR